MTDEFSSHQAFWKVSHFSKYFLGYCDLNQQPRQLQFYTMGLKSSVLVWKKSIQNSCNRFLALFLYRFVPPVFVNISCFIFLVSIFNNNKNLNKFLGCFVSVSHCCRLSCFSNCLQMLMSVKLLGPTLTNNSFQPWLTNCVPANPCFLTVNNAMFQGCGAGLYFPWFSWKPTLWIEPPHVRWDSKRALLSRQIWTSVFRARGGLWRVADASLRE